MSEDLRHSRYSIVVIKRREGGDVRIACRVVRLLRAPVGRVTHTRDVVSRKLTKALYRFY